MDATEAQDLRQSDEYGEYIGKIGWHVEKILKTNDQEPNKFPKTKHINVFIRKLGWFGAIAKIQRVQTPLSWTEIAPVLKKHRVWMTKLEPIDMARGSELVVHGFKKDGNPFLCSKTIRIDLTRKNLLETFKKDARYCIRKARSTLPVVHSNDFEKFYDMWKKANGIKHLWTPSKKDFDSLVNAFGKKCFCVTIGELAGALVLMHDRVAYYYYAGSLPEGKKLELPYLVVWECMQQAKKLGCKMWDFEGIYDPRWPNKDIRGYTHFKKSFGGEEVEFPGSFTKWF